MQTTYIEPKQLIKQLTGNSKNYQKFIKLLPNDGFITLNKDNFKAMMKIIRDEPDKKLRKMYFSLVLDKLFATGWGWYGRLGKSLSSVREFRYANELPEKTRADALAVLRLVKNMHLELRYSPSYIGIINHYIRDFGGNTIEHGSNKAKKEQFEMVTKKLQMGEKLPRKIKKQVKQQLQKQR